MKEEVTLGELVDCSMEEFEELMKNKTMGDMTNLYNLLAVVYEDLTTKKDALKMKRINGDYTPEEYEDLEKTLSSIYPVMQRVEEKATYLYKRRTELSRL